MSPISGKLRRFSVIIIVVVFVEKTCTQSGVTSNDLGDLYHAFVKNLAYFDKEHKSLDSEALLGLRIAEGYINRIVNDCQRGKIKTNLNVYNNLTDLQNRAAGAREKLLPVVRDSDPGFYPLLGSEWQYYKPYKSLLLDDVSQKNEVKPKDIEMKYSSCVDDIVGSERSGSETCTISDECWDLMTEHRARRDLLQYQALFFILGEAAGCLDKLTSQLEASGIKLEEHLNDICALSYYSVSWTGFHGMGDPKDLILVLKHSFTCGVLGFHELLKDQGLSNVIGWQLSKGCYGDYTRVGEARKSASVDKQANRELKSAYLGEGCLTDVTGVGVGLLAVYLRWILDPPPQVQPVNLLKSAEEGAQTVSVYMFGLVLLTAAFLIVSRRSIFSMGFYFWNFLCRKRG